MSENIFIPKGVLKKKNKFKRQDIPSDIFAGSNNDIPGKIIVYYSNNINLSIIDQAIKHRFQKLKLGIGDIKKEVKELQKEKNEKNMVSEKHYCEKIIQEKLIFIDSIENDILFNKYVNETEELLNVYQKNKNINLAELYLTKANKYITIERIKKIETNFTCNGCNQDLFMLPEDSEGFFTCPECHSLNEKIKPNKYIKDLENYNFNYEEDVNNFSKIIDKFEGKNTIPVPLELLDKLDKYFEDKGMKKGEYYRNQPCLENGKKLDTSRKKLWTALEKLNYNQFYDETSYLAHIYWGWDIPDLSLYRDQIIKDYQNTQMVWNLIKNDYKRSASLGTQYRLYVHLLAVEYPYCDRDDFKIQDMVESLRLHNNAWQRMCQGANIKYYPVTS